MSAAETLVAPRPSVADALREAAGDAVLELDPAGTVLQARFAGAALAALAPGLTPSASLCASVHEADRAALRQALESVHTTGGVVRVHTHMGAAPGQCVEWRIAAGRAEGRPRLVAVGRDTGEQRQAEQRLRHLATHDALTELPNRSLLDERLREAAQQSAESGMAFSLGVIDLDGFKRINDSLGHPVGDELLRAVAARLRNLMRQGDTLARVGGDEFVLVLPRVGRAADLLQVGRRITAALEAPFAIAARQLHISASVGFACCPEHAQDPVRLLSQADLALYRAKGAGKNRTVVYDKEWECAEDGLSMESALRTGFANGEFFPVYQPIVELASGRIVGAEALMRWNRPGHGLIPPASFIPAAESIGLIDALGSWMLRAACVQSADFQQRSDTALFVSVNVSPSQFHTDLVQTVREALALRATPGTQLRLEITESALMRNPKHSAQMLEQLADLGVRLAVDDFGTGYSSFAYLRDFPLSTLKVDRSFVASLPASKKDAAICTALFALARELGLQCVAEGVETAAQAQFLREHGCPLGQGFFLGQPMTAPQFLAYLDARRSVRA